MSTAKKNTPNPPKASSPSADFAFGKENYFLMVLGLVVILIGYFLMIGGGSEDPNVFNPEVFSTRRITIAPLMVLTGLGIEVYAIVKKSKE